MACSINPAFHSQSSQTGFIWFNCLMHIINTDFCNVLAECLLRGRNQSSQLLFRSTLSSAKPSKQQQKRICAYCYNSYLGYHCCIWHCCVSFSLGYPADVIAFEVAWRTPLGFSVLQRVLQISNRFSLSRARRTYSRPVSFLPNYCPCQDCQSRTSFGHCTNTVSLPQWAAGVIIELHTTGHPYSCVDVRQQDQASTCSVSAARSVGNLTITAENNTSCVKYSFNTKPCMYMWTAA